MSQDARTVAQNARLAVFCTPIGSMPELASAIAATLAPEAAVTDAGSVKAGVVRDLTAILGGRFVGAHPMAGSEKSGSEAARADLFQGAACILTPSDQSTPEALTAVRQLWRDVGGKLLEMSADAHDEAVGRVSHLPHAIASLLVHTAAASASDPLPLAGAGYRDSTRIAAGPAAMWSEIFLTNKEAVLSGLRDFSQLLQEMEKMLMSNDAAALEGFLARAKAIRDQLP